MIKPSFAYAHNDLFVSSPLQEQVLDGPENKKPSELSFERLSLVAGIGETSNFKLLKDLAKVIECVTELEHTIW